LQYPTSIYNSHVVAIKETKIQKKVIELASSMQSKMNNFMTFILQEVAAQGFDFTKLLASYTNILTSTSSSIKKLAKNEKKLYAVYAHTALLSGQAKHSVPHSNLANNFKTLLKSVQMLT